MAVLEMESQIRGIPSVLQHFPTQFAVSAIYFDVMVSCDSQAANRRLIPSIVVAVVHVALYGKCLLA